MQVTPNYGLKKIELTDSPPDITVHSGNFDIIDAQLKINSNEINILKCLSVATGTNNYSVSVPNLVLVEGVELKVKFVNASTSNPTLNVNELGVKAIKKASGSPATIKANSYLKLIYSGTDFILLGEGGEYGTAQAQQVLQGYTVGTEDGLTEGIIQKFTSSVDAPFGFSAGGYVAGKLTTGYYDNAYALLRDANFKAENIKAGVSMFRQIGTLEEKKVATGTFSTGGYTITKNIGFRAKYIMTYGQVQYNNWYIYSIYPGDGYIYELSSTAYGSCGRSAVGNSITDTGFTIGVGASRSAGQDGYWVAFG